MAWYKTGTVAVTNASTTVTGTGTNFVSGAQVGDGFLGPNELLYEITAINSATSLTIAPAYGGATASSQSYAIAPTQGLVASLASDVTDLITDYQSVVDNAGAGKFGDGSAASPAIRFTNDQDTGFFRDTANEIAFATAGVKRGEFTSSGIQLLDGQKFIAGTGNDLQIYHDGSNSYIDEAGTGTLRIRGYNQVRITDMSDNIAAIFKGDAETTLYHNNAAKLATTSTGVDISGVLTSDGLTVDGNASVITLNNTDGSLSLGQTLGEIKFNQNDPSDQGVGTVASIEVENRGSIAGYGKFNFKTGSATSLLDRLSIAENGDISFYEDTGTTAKLHWSAADESLGIGTLAPRTGLHLYGAGQTTSAISDAGNLGAFLRVSDTGTDGGSGGGVIFGSNQSEADGFAGFAAIKGLLSNGNDRTIGALAFSTRAANAATALTERMRLTSDGNVGISSSSPTSLGTGITTLELKGNSASQTDRAGGIRFERYDGTYAGAIYNADGAFKHDSGAYPMLFVTNSAERMRLDASGNLLVGTTNASLGTGGIQLNASGRIGASASSLSPMILNRETSDGTIINFRKDGTNVGTIGTVGGNLAINSEGAGGYGRLQTQGSDRFVWYQGAFYPAIDNIYDLGVASTGRFDDIYATNGTIQTSDRNEKQDIEALSDAEQRVAVACKGLLRKFRWKDAVAEKGDDARIHFGIIAQDLQDAFTAEGLDAGRYAMFISSTWTDEETGEERTRMGVRYSELLAFIIAAI